MTDRDEVVAELRPPGILTASPDAGPDGVLERLVSEGVVSSPLLDRSNWSWPPEGLDLPQGTARELLDAVWSDRTGSDEE